MMLASMLLSRLISLSTASYTNTPVTTHMISTDITAPTTSGQEREQTHHTLRHTIDIGVEGLETGSRERIVTIHFRVQTPCCARTAKFLPSLSPVDCVSCSVTGFHSC